MTNKKAEWIVGVDAYTDNDSSNYIIHLTSPRFVAKWVIEDEEDPTTVIADAHAFSGSEDDEEVLNVYDVQWIDDAVAENEVRPLIQQAADAVDHYLDEIYSMDDISEQ